MTVNNITVSVAGTIYPVKRGSFKLGDKVDEVSRFGCTLRDDAGTAHFHKPQQVIVSDSSGTIFTGEVATDEEDKVPAQSMIWHTIDTLDPTEKARKRTAEKQYAGQYAGIIVADMAKNVLAAEGITANYAIDVDDTQSDFVAGTLSNTTATADGNLELSLAGSVVSFTVDPNNHIFTTFGGNNTGTYVSNATMKAIEFTASCTVPGAGNSYLYISIMRSVAYTIVSGDQLTYEMWLPKSSQMTKGGIDFVCTDGSTLREVGNTFDGQYLSPHPNTDLKGYENQWYSRTFNINVAGLSGKIIDFITIAFEGDDTGDYSAYFRRIKIINGATVKVDVFNDASAVTPNIPQVVQRSSYTNERVAIVNAYDSSCVIESTSATISSAGIYRTSLVSYSADLPDGCEIKITGQMDRVSGDTPAVFELLTNNTPMPGLVAGMDLTNLSSFFFIYLYNNSDFPTITPKFYSFNLTVNPSYSASKSDVRHKTKLTADYSGILTNLTAASDLLSITGYQHKFDYSNPSATLYGNGSPAWQLFNRSIEVTVNLNAGNNTDAKLKMNDAGNWQNFIAEVDISFAAAAVTAGLFFRTTNYGNGNNNYAYIIYVKTTEIGFARGSNSSSGSDGTFTSITTTALTLSTNTWYKLKIQANGSTFDAWLNDVHYIIGATNTAYSATGGIGPHVFNGTGANGAKVYFRNFGVVASLSGTYITPAINISGAGTAILAAFTRTQIAGDLAQGKFTTEISLNNGSTWTDCAGVLATTQDINTSNYLAETVPGLAPATSVSAITQAKLRLTLSISSAAAHLETRGTIFYVLSGYSASGTRISPALSLTGAGRVGSTLVAWNAVTPTGTSLVVATSPTGSGSWTDRTNGGTIAGITSQPDLILDTFTSNTAASYTQGNFGGITGTFVWDTSNSRLTGSGGNIGTLLYTALSIANGQVMGDFDQADGSGLIANRNTGTGSGYYIQIWDASAGSNQNSVKLFRRASSVSTQIGSTAVISFVRGQYHRFILDVQAGVLIVKMDGAVIISYTDGSPLGVGQMGIVLVTLLRCYNLRIQGYGDNLTGVNAYTRTTLTSTNPLFTPQQQNLTLAALSPDIGIGALIADTLDYRDTHIDANLDDLSTRSNYHSTIRSDLSLSFGARQTTPAPWILVSTDPLLLLAGLKVSNKGDTYRNRQKLTGVLDPVTGAATYTVTRNNTGGFAGTISQSQYATDEGGSGIVENVEDVSNQNMTVAQANAYGDQLLQIHGVIGRTIRFTTRRTGLRVGQYLSVFILEHNLFDASMLIVSIDVAAVIVTDSGGNSTMEYRYTVEATETTNTGSWAKLMSSVLR